MSAGKKLAGGSPFRFVYWMPAALILLGGITCGRGQDASPTPAQGPQPKANPGIPNLTQRWTNSLGQVFAPVPGTPAMFCIWDVRVKDFEAFVAATGHDATQRMYSEEVDGWKIKGENWKNPGFKQGPTHPVVGVSWDDAKAFCNWLTTKERTEGRLAPGQTYRLPTDWEWGIAVGLKQPKEGSPREKSGKIPGIFPWGTKWPPPKGSGNYAGAEAKNARWPAAWNVIADYQDGYPRTSPVGSFPPNALGLYDMGGNVWQWCEDFYEGQSGPRVLRGASWNGTEPDACSSRRERDTAEARVNNYGFRVVIAGTESP